MRTLVGSLLFLLLLLQGQLWFGQGSLPDLWRLQSNIREQQVENLELEIRNEALVAEVKDLKSGLEAIEERARNELGMIRRGETFYQVPDNIDAVETDSETPAQDESSDQ